MPVLSNIDSESFWRRVQKAEGCWLWTGAINNGYGRFRARGGRLLYAHRVAYESERGPIAASLQLDHLCRVRRCVNPNHLEQVTAKENIRRGLRGALITNCPAGHKYTAINTLYRANGHRRCRQCHMERERARTAHRREIDGTQVLAHR